MSLRAMMVGEAPPTLDEVVLGQLRSWITAGRLPPGTRLIETAIGDELGVSRGPVREAIRQLAGEGYVTLSPRRGASVAGITPNQVRECCEIRMALEGVAAHLAASRRTDEDVERFRDVLLRGDQALGKGRLGEVATLNIEFHDALAAASGNRELIVINAQYAERMRWMRSQSLTGPGVAAWTEHAHAAQAIIEGDAKRAGILARRHIARSGEHLIAAIEAGA